MTARDWREFLGWRVRLWLESAAMRADNASRRADASYSRRINGRAPTRFDRLVDRVAGQFDSARGYPRRRLRRVFYLARYPRWYARQTALGWLMARLAPWAHYAGRYESEYEHQSRVAWLDAHAEYAYASTGDVSEFGAHYAAHAYRPPWARQVEWWLVGTTAAGFVWAHQYQTADAIEAQFVQADADYGAWLDATESDDYADGAGAPADDAPMIGHQLTYTPADADAHYENRIAQQDCALCLLGMPNSHGFGADAETVARLGAGWYKSTGRE